MKTNDAIIKLLTLQEVLSFRLMKNLQELKALIEYDSGKGTQHLIDIGMTLGAAQAYQEILECINLDIDKKELKDTK